MSGQSTRRRRRRTDAVRGSRSRRRQNVHGQLVHIARADTSAAARLAPDVSAQNSPAGPVLTVGRGSRASRGRRSATAGRRPAPVRLVAPRVPDRLSAHDGDAAPKFSRSPAILRASPRMDAAFSRASDVAVTEHRAHSRLRHCETPRARALHGWCSLRVKRHCRSSSPATTTSFRRQARSPARQLTPQCKLYAAVASTSARPAPSRPGIVRGRARARSTALIAVQTRRLRLLRPRLELEREFEYSRRNGIAAERFRRRSFSHRDTVGNMPRSVVCHCARSSRARTGAIGSATAARYRCVHLAAAGRRAVQSPARRIRQLIGGDARHQHRSRLR